MQTFVAKQLFENFEVVAVEIGYTKVRVLVELSCSAVDELDLRTWQGVELA